MTGKTHIAFGVLLGTTYAINSTQDLGMTAAIIGTTAVFSIFPDICHTGSKVGRKMFPISLLIKLFFGHRTFTHSLFFIAMIAVVLTLLNIQLTYIICAAIGIFSHILLDMLTPRGVALFFPLDKKIVLPVTFKTGGILDASLATTFSILTAYLIYSEMFHRTLSFFKL